MERRTRWAVAGVALALALAPVTASAAPTQSPAPTEPTAQIDGRLVDVMQMGAGDDAGHDAAPDAASGHGSMLVHALRDDATGLLLPIEDPGLPNGTRVMLTVEVPAAAQEVVPDGVVDEARHEAAEPGSALSRAAADAAVDAGVPLAVSAAAPTAPLAADTLATTATASTGGVAAATSVEHPVTVAVVGFGSVNTQYTDATVTSMLSTASAFWSRQSGGSVSFAQAGAITRYTTAVACSNYSALWNEAAAKTGWSGTPGTHLAVLLPRGAAGCSYGLGSVGTSTGSGGQVYVADASWTALAHELGHNLSLQHSNRLVCTGTTVDSALDAAGAPKAPCRSSEYGDGMDVMGSSALSGTGGLNAAQRARLGWLTPTAVTAAGVTTLTLRPLGTGAATGTAAAVTDPRSGTTYFLENRQKTSDDSYGWWGSGAAASWGVRVLKRSGSGASLLLDPSPTDGADTDVAVRAGSTLALAGDGVELRPQATAGDGSVSIAISLAGTGAAHWPSDATATAMTSAPVTVPAGTAARVTAAVAAVDGKPLTTGTVTASLQGTPRGTVAVVGGKVTFALPVLPPGTHTLDLAYTPVVANKGAVQYASTTGTATVVVTPLASSVKGVITSKDVSSADRAVVTVTVTAKGAVPTGTVSVTEGSTTIGTGTLDGGRAAVVLAAVPAGTHLLTLGYGGDSTTLASTGAGPDLRVAAKPMTVVRATATKTTAGAASAVTVTSSAPGGRDTSALVTVSESGSVLATGTPVKGRVVLALPVLAAGTHTLTVTQAGAAAVDGGTAALTLVVAKAKPVVTAGLAAGSVTAGSGTAVTVTATSPAGAATGAVQLKEGTRVLAAAALAGDGTASLSVPSDLKVGKHSLVVGYAGDGQLVAGTAKPVVLTVTKAA